MNSTTRYLASLVPIGLWGGIWGKDLVMLIPGNEWWILDIKATLFILPILFFFWWGLKK